VSAPATLFEKIWRAHAVQPIADGALLLIDRVLLHERTGGVALRSLADAGRTVAAPDQVFATMDHVVDTLPGRGDVTIMPTGTDFIRATRAETRAAGIRLFDIGDPGQGIVHVISPEQGIVLPGLTLVCPDSHTCTQGALGALAWGIGSTEAEHALATRTLRVLKPRAMRVTVRGRLSGGVTAKDLALHILAAHGTSGGNGHIVEYAGEGIRALDVEARMTLCNLATEFAAFSAIIAPDAAVFDYLQGRRFAPQGSAWDAAVAAWATLASDADAPFDADITIDARAVAPMVSWGTSPQDTVAIDGAVPASARQRALEYMGLDVGRPLAGLPIGAAFIGSCTNSRLSDLRRAAALLDGRHVAAGVRAICVPGSTAVKRAAEAEGLHRIFQAAGFDWRESGCSMCFFAGGESFGAGERVITSTNRNFESRQGPGTRSHLASPETVAASALAGVIADPREYAR
jgi:3-isopropylmalate/(R)-2-methylmalate dehydratase large subunit